MDYDKLRAKMHEDRQTYVDENGDYWAVGNMDNFTGAVKGIAIDKLAELEDKIENGTLIELPCKVGDTVYKICPKCNEKHNGSCENCAWCGCLNSHGCDVFGLWSDGRYPPKKCTIVPYTMNWRFIPVVLKHIGTKIFLTREEAEKRLEELKK